jgi:predicted dehydrogenase
MNVMIVGAGRMGIRHALGAVKSKADRILITDISEKSLDNAKAQLITKENKHRLEFRPFDKKGNEKFDVVIFATTAKDRLGQFKNVMDNSPSFVLFEKPLGQHFEEVQELILEVKDSGIRSFVNLNMRMYDFVKDLKRDLNDLSQFAGVKRINFSGGCLGISANGIHYLDLLLFLFDANHASILAGEIEDTVIQSGRGAEFGDYGGWAYIKFFDIYDTLLGTSYISLTANSSAFGGWDIIGQNGRIRVNELEGERIDILRDQHSDMPLYRYAADYLPPIVRKIESPFLGDLTSKWLDSLVEDAGAIALPTLEEAFLSHKLLFDWIAKNNKSGQEQFLIT